MATKKVAEAKVSDARARVAAAKEKAAEKKERAIANIADARELAKKQRSKESR